MARGSVVGECQCRRGHDAQHRLMVAHQGDVDRELAIAADELLGAVERVHQPQLGPGAADRKRVRGLGFLGQHRDRRRQRRELARENLVSRTVGKGDRRLVCLVLDPVGRGIDLENGGGRLGDGVADAGEQDCGIGWQGGTPVRGLQPLS